MDNIYQDYIDARQSDVKARYRYYSMVRLATETQVSKIEGIEKRKLGAYVVDHIVPISIGYLAGIPISKMASLENLQLITHSDNNKKKDKIIPEGESLLIKWGIL